MLLDAVVYFCVLLPFPVLLVLPCHHFGLQSRARGPNLSVAAGASVAVLLFCCLLVLPSFVLAVARRRCCSSTVLTIIIGSSCCCRRCRHRCMSLLLSTAMMFFVVRCSSCCCSRSSCFLDPVDLVLLVLVLALGVAFVLTISHLPWNSLEIDQTVCVYMFSQSLIFNFAAGRLNSCFSDRFLKKNKQV